MSNYRNKFMENVSIASIANELPSVIGGKRNMQLAAKVMTALADMDGKVGMPSIRAVSDAIDNAATSTITFHGSNFLQQAIDSATQTVASLKVWGTTTNYVTVYSRVPGEIGNDTLLVISAASGAASVTDSLVTSDTPTVTWVPQTGNVDASITALNTSKLVFAIKSGSGGTIATLSSTPLAGGVGAGVKLYIGNELIQDASTHGASFAGSSNNSYIRRWSDSQVRVEIDELDILAGVAIPTNDPWGEANTEIVAATNDAGTKFAGGTVAVGLEWTRPLYFAEALVAIRA